MPALRLRLTRAALAVLALACAAQSLLVFVAPGVVLEHRRRFNELTASMNGMKLESSATPLGELYLNSVVSLAASALALALLWRAAERPAARVLALFLCTTFFPALAFIGAGVPYEAVMVLMSAMSWLSMAAFLRFAALFPHPLTRGDLERADRVRAARRGRAPRPVSRSRRLLLDPRFVWGGAVAMSLFAIVTTATGRTGLQAFALPLLVWSVVRAVGLLRSSLTVADEAGRRSILWVVQGFYAMLWLGVFVVGSVVWGMWSGYRHAQAGGTMADYQMPYAVLMVASVGQSLSVLFVVACLAVAIFFYGALDPRLALKGTTVYAMVGVAGALLFAIVENAVSGVMVDSLRLSEGVGGPVAGGIVALATGPIRDAIARSVERRFTARAAAPENVGMAPALA
jgi:hypothetical protein